MKIQTIDQLRDIYPGPTGRAAVKVFQRLEQHSRQFLTLSPLSLVRSELWNSEKQIPRSTLATMSEMINAQTGRNDPVESQAEMETRHLNEL